MADSKKMKSVKIHTLEDTFVELSVAKTATTQEVIEMVFQKMNMRDETAGFTLAERTRKTGECTSDHGVGAPGVCGRVAGVAV